MRTSLMVITAFLLAPAAVADLAETEKKIVAAAAEVESLRANITTEMEVANPNMQMSSTGKGTFEFKRADGKRKHRMELESVVRMKMGEQEQKQETETLTVADGEYSYSLVEQFGQQMATKQKIDETQSFFPDDKFFERLGEEFTLKQLEEAKVNGKPTYVIEATPKEESGSGKQVYYFDQKSGMVVKVEIYSPDGKPLTTMTLSNVELNVDIPAERFEFEAPEGVTVQEVPTQ